MHEVLLFGAAFLAGAVEMVETMTIVLAVGVTKGWRTALTGAVAALIVLTLIIATLGRSLVDLVPIDYLQITVGVLLLVFGMQWLRKAILRTAGLKAEHDEDKIFADEVKELSQVSPSGEGLDWQGFVVSFKGVFLEGLEVAFIIVTFAANSGRMDLAAGGAATAFVLIAGLGFVIHRPLSRVPENAIKHTVGVMLMAFGTFWGAEGVGIVWQLDAAAIIVITGFYWLASLVLIASLKRQQASAGRRAEAPA
jgi:uncharacterized membrane protein